MRMHSLLRLGAALGLVIALGCNRSDVGAPCQHAEDDPPSEPLISFPALACEQLLCVFGESLDPPVDPCESDADCAQLSGGKDAFVCASGRCVVGRQAVLERSMCSATCVSDSDCAEAAEGTRCAPGFACAPLMSLGEFCCEKVCVCRDDLDVARVEQLAADCAAQDVPGCCDRDPMPEGCG